MKEDDWEACTKKDEFKRMIVGLLFFHANIQVRGNLVACIRSYLKHWHLLPRRLEYFAMIIT